MEDGHSPSAAAAAMTWRHGMEGSFGVAGMEDGSLSAASAMEDGGSPSAAAGATAWSHDMEHDGSFGAAGMEEGSSSGASVMEDGDSSMVDNIKVEEYIREMEDADNIFMDQHRSNMQVSKFLLTTSVLASHAFCVYGGFVCSGWLRCKILLMHGLLAWTTFLMLKIKMA
jgi:hypothetical protein